MKRLILALGVLLALVPVTVAAATSGSDQVRVRGTNELGTYSLLYCTSDGYCNDATNALPSGAPVDTIVGQKNYRAWTKYGWSYFWYPTIATCVPSTYSNKTMKCGIS